VKNPYIVTVYGIGLGSGDYDAGPNASTAAGEIAFLARRYPTARFTVRLPRGGVLIANRPKAVRELEARVRASGVTS
jgi:hypothetical protein